MDIRLAILLRLLVLINQLVLYVHPTIYFYKFRTGSTLPKSLKKSETVTIFEKKLKTFLFCHYFNS